MGEAPLAKTLRDVAATLVADAPFSETLQRIADLACDIGTPAVGVALQLVDERGRRTAEARTGLPASLLDTAGERLSVPMTASGVTLGTITLYAPGAGSF